MSKRLRAVQVVVGSMIVALCAVVSVESPAPASQPSSPGPASTLPSAVPSAATPPVDDGRVFGIAQVGNTMVIGGSFTSVGGQTRSRVAAFNTQTGALSSAFAPSLNGDVNAVVPGPNDHTVYVGGAFTQVNGTARQFVVLLDLNNGQVVTSFAPVAFNFGYVNDMVKQGNRLYLAGTFTAAGGKTHAGLAALNATTGAVDPFMGVQLTGHHNDTGSGAQGWVGPWDLDVNPQGDTMVVTGNFKYADGLLRDQIVRISLSGAAAAVDSGWATQRYAPQCYNWAFDGYVRGVSFSPDGSYFVVNATGGGVGGTLCDATARFNTSDSGSDVQPVWVNETGGDTVWGVTVTDTAVYIGGHNRWSNNPNGVDYPGAGALPRPGLGALDPVSGRPFTWNPGRRPLGVAVFAMLATPQGLWIGSNNDYIGNYKYKRPKLAFFPYAGGYQPASTGTSNLPGAVYLAGATGTGTTNVLYRVNAGGPAVQAIDGGPDWAADDSDPSSVRNSGSNAAGWTAGASVAGTVPSSTPSTVFDSERWSPSDNPAMNWDFPVQAGVPLQVRLYFANRCSCTSSPGSRVFRVALDGTTVLNNYDIVSDVGDQRGTMKSFNITSDGNVDIDFSHVVENPLINAIEIIRTDVDPQPPTGVDTLAAYNFNGSTATPATVTSQNIGFGSWRGAFKVGNKVFYGATDSKLHSRTFDGSTFGPDVVIDPYNDPDWSNVQTDLGQTFRGTVPSLYGQLPNVTGMVYSGGRLYYTLYNDPALRWRWFSPDSGVVDERSATVPSSVSFNQADGLFIDGNRLYYGDRSTGSLRRVTFDGGSVTGAATVVSGPSVDDVDWRNRAMFLDGAAPANQPPTAAFTASCSGFSCSFNANGSNDSDGTIASYSWNFGDGDSGSGVSPTHTFDGAGSYDVTLTVTDDAGASASVTHQVQASEPPASHLGFVAAAEGQGGNRMFQQATVPTAAQPGDTMLLFLSRTTPTTWSGPSGVTGWTEVGTYASASLTTTVWRKTVAAGDPGATVRLDTTAYTHASLNLAVYSGVDTANPIAAVTQAGDAGGTSHVAPAVSAGDGDWVVSFWGERSAATTAWSAPAGVTTRSVTSDSGSLTVTALVGDSGGPVAAGSYGARTAVTDVATQRTAMWSIALNAAP
jgi:PKD repeat protein